MTKLVVLSGKGGTGKTTVSSYLIEKLGINKYGDCDVDAPNLHQIAKFDQKDEIIEPYTGATLFKIDQSKCKHCGLCYNSCRFLAIKKENKHFEINPYMCEGCGLCQAVCPFDVISEYSEPTGSIKSYITKDTAFVTAKLKVGAGASGKLVSAVRRNLNNIELSSEITLVDGSPGVGCAVIASLTGNDYSVIVTEASKSGFSDLERIVTVSSKMNVSPLIIVNKADLNPNITEDIRMFSINNDIPFLGSISYDPNILKRNNKVVYDKSSKGLLDLEKISNNLKKILKGGI